MFVSETFEGTESVPKPQEKLKKRPKSQVKPKNNLFVNEDLGMGTECMPGELAEEIDEQDEVELERKKQEKEERIRQEKGKIYI